jgi:ADP-heptose:LPS heptosyltransferase
MNDQVLVIKLGALGDIFLALESFQSIRARHRDARITLLTRPAFVALARQMPWFDAVEADPSPKLWRLWAIWSLRRRFRAARYQRVYDLQGNDRAQFYRCLGGWATDVWMTASLTEKTIARRGLPRLPVAQRHRELLAATGVPFAGAANLSWLDAPLDGFDLPERFFILIPGSAPTRLEKRWPPERYAELGRKLIGQGLTPVVIGTAADEPALSIVCAHLPEAINLSGRTSISQLAALARRAAGVVGNDTGPIHIAAAVGARTLVLMSGQSDPVRMKPNGPEVDCVQATHLKELSVAETWAALHLRPATKA